MHDHCYTIGCGAVLRAGDGSIINYGFDGWCCAKCTVQLTMTQVSLLVPGPAPEPRRPPKWWRR